MSIAIPFVKELKAQFPKLNIGLAGGLGAGIGQDVIKQIKYLVPISVDAESGLFSNGRLNRVSTLNYFKSMHSIFER